MYVRSAGSPLEALPSIAVNGCRLGFSKKIWTQGLAGKQAAILQADENEHGGGRPDVFVRLDSVTFERMQNERLGINTCPNGFGEGLP